MGSPKKDGPERTLSQAPAWPLPCPMGVVRDEKPKPWDLRVRTSEGAYLAASSQLLWFQRRVLEPSAEPLPLQPHQRTHLRKINVYILIQVPAVAESTAS